jgi:hypothetical protein
MACCHDPLPRRTRRPRVASYHWWVSATHRAASFTNRAWHLNPHYKPGQEKAPARGTGAKTAGRRGNWGCSAVQRHDLNARRPVWFLSLQGCGIAATTRHHPSRIAKYAFPQPCDSVSNTMPIGVFPPIRLGPVPTGLFLGHRAKKEQGRALLDDANPWPAFLLLLPGGASRRPRGSPSHDLDRAAKPSDQPVLRLTYDYSKLSPAACHHKRDLAGRLERNGVTVPRFGDGRVTGRLRREPDRSAAA